jgi:hypothetical protein
MDRSVGKVGQDRSCGRNPRALEAPAFKARILRMHSKAPAHACAQVLEGEAPGASGVLADVDDGHGGGAVALCSW